LGVNDWCRVAAPANNRCRETEFPELARFLEKSFSERFGIVAGAWPDGAGFVVLRRPLPLCAAMSH
jgi:hypothetical protein